MLWFFADTADLEQKKKKKEKIPRKLSTATMINDTKEATLQTIWILPRFKTELWTSEYLHVRICYSILTCRNHN